MKRVFISGVVVGLGFAAVASVVLLKQTDDVIAEEIVSFSEADQAVAPTANPFDPAEPFASTLAGSEVADYPPDGDVAAPALEFQSALNEPAALEDEFNLDPPQAVAGDSASSPFSDLQPTTAAVGFGQDAFRESSGLFTDDPAAAQNNPFAAPPVHDPFSATRHVGNVRPVDEEILLRQQFLELARKQSELMTTAELKSAVGVAATSVSELAAKRSLERARVLLEQILEQHPESTAAKAARDMLKPSDSPQADHPLEAGEEENSDGLGFEPPDVSVPNEETSSARPGETE